MEALEANRRLATALGWTNIVAVGGSLLGKPPPGEPECRGQAAVPDWAGDWRACGPLLDAHQIAIQPSNFTSGGKYFAYYADGMEVGEFSDVIQLAVVRAVCRKLENYRCGGD